MNRRLLRLVSVTILVCTWLLLPTPAETQGYTTVPGSYTGRPHCAPRQSPNSYGCVAKSATNTVRVTAWAGGLYPVQTLGVNTVRNPSCAQERVSIYDFDLTICATVGADNALYGFGFAVDRSSGALTLQTPVRNLGGAIAGDPSCVLTEPNQDTDSGFATCAAVDLNNRLVAIRFNPSTGVTSGWQVLGGTVVDNPSCVAAREGLQQVICAVKGTNNSLFGIRFGPQTGYTSGFKGVAGGNFVGSPSCANTGTGVATCAVRNDRNALVAVRFNPNTGAKSALQNLGGTWIGDPSCAPALQGQNRAVCVVRATDNSLEAIRFNPANDFRTGYVEIPGLFATDVSCAHGSIPAGASDYGVYCAARRPDNGLSLFFVWP